MKIVEDFYLEIHDLNSTVEVGNAVLVLKKIEVNNALEYVSANGSANKIFIDPEELKRPLLLRTWKQGDRMQPYGMKGSKLISDMLTDSKIPSLIREKALVLTSGKDIIWLVGIRASKHYKITKTTKTIIEITTEL